MKKIFKKEQLQLIEELPSEVIASIEENIMVLGENYGYNRDVDKDLGGYVLILETSEEVELAKNKILVGVIPEYTDKVGDYSSTLFLLSDDYAVVVITHNNLTNELIEE